MSSIGTGYDLDADTFSPDGRIFQVEYATKAVDNTGTAIGLCCTDGVVIGIEKLLVSKMLVPGSNRRSFAVDTHTGIGVAGLSADGRQVANRARAECSEYKKTFGAPMEGKVLADRLSMFLHMYTLYWSLRPFGCSTLLASYTDDGPQLYMIDPSGSSWGYWGCAIGKGRQVAKTELEKLSLGKITCAEAVKAIANIIYQVHDETKDKIWELEMGWVCDANGRKYTPVPAELVKEAEEEAKKAAAAPPPKGDDKMDES
jgi:20S proteasome subunit alpha 7|uniref:Proteasome alpha-type subunits domain-containing protein n=1 Tax=Eutreptiella gymnastica TaxID=73025 RepID=A0A7S4C8L4_9EUGL